MTFRYWKLYADVVTPEGTVAIVYLTRLEVWGWVMDDAGLELYHPDGSREVLRARDAPDPSVFASAPLKSFALGFGDDRLELEYRAALPAWVPPGGLPEPHLKWQVLVPRAAVRARWSPGSRRADLSGEGYADWLELRRPPRRLGLAAVAWGRVHLPAETLVFIHLTLCSGSRWQRAARWTGGEPWATDEFALESAATGLVLRAPAAGAGGIILAWGRVLHQGAALDAARFPSYWRRLLARWLAGPIVETRRASPLAGLAGSPDRICAVHEVVRFGGR